MRKLKHKEVKNLAEFVQILNDWAEIQTPGVRFQSVIVLRTSAIFTFWDNVFIAQLFSVAICLYSRHPHYSLSIDRWLQLILCGMFLSVFFFLNYIYWDDWHWLAKLYRFEVYNSVIHNLYIALCAHHQESVLLSWILVSYLLLCLCRWNKNKNEDQFLK